ncbi:penicillin-binding protein [Synechococcus elongatus PCC 6301]|uniref:Penicillin-binding protein n=1 Tax=Synechococcus sp. (strain ATCC 27144 / PCC 6301 / SAUG 1402/1) TaxID=269084 RepID=A0A0H3K4U0_SYNP6|nr:transglycosylase domain-containing protein [Synechococcus elongatus]BAD80286.1 penicillin-binding protein [Synechococcus elongatus PCC 6301]
MSDRPQPAPTVLKRLTQLATQVQRRAKFDNLNLRDSDSVPQLTVCQGDRRQSYPLLGDYYRLGRGRDCDIPIDSPIVSKLHLSLGRSGKERGDFVLQDENSTNGVFWRGRRVDRLELQHGDRIYLGPPELTDRVELLCENAPPLWQDWLKRGVTITTAVVGAIAIGITLEASRVSVRSLGTVQGPIAAYAADGEPLQTLRSSSHVELPALSDFSPVLPKALLASEDSRFYWHLGIDPYGTARAILTNFRSGEVREGASTLTQQIARSLFSDYVGREDSIGRKVREAILALKLEFFYSKDELLRTYLNRVYLGVGYGFEDAAQIYFGKSARDLSTSEAALLVGLLPSPNGFSPCTNLAAAQRQKNGVIERMQSLGLISEEEARTARRSPVTIKPEACQTSSRVTAPYYYGAVVEELAQLVGDTVVEEGNFAVETSLNPAMQTAAEQSLQSLLAQTAGVKQGAIVTIDSRNGEIRALVGGVDYQASQFDRATQAYRQPGSTFKVFAYAAALEQGISAGRPYDCSPLVWQGQQFRGCERSSGSIDLARALAQSENAVALRVAREVGLDAVVQMARKFGIKADLQPVPGLVLGQSEVTLLEMTSAFAAIANEGRWNPPHAIRRIYDSSRCTTAEQRRSCTLTFDVQQQPRRDRVVISAATAATLTAMLQQAVSSGTGGAAAIGYGAAGKTGTTNDGVDLWFVGFVPSRHLVTGVWLGNDDNQPTGNSSSLAAQLWGDYMARILR